jgi:lipopolysaccharide biosynthesis glycosyltransferase
MNIVYSSSDLYAEPTAISIYSLLTNNQNIGELNLYILESSISAQNRAIISDIVKSFGRTVTFIDADEIFATVAPRFNLELLRGAYSTYARVFINHFLPDLDKVILIDSDTLVLGSLYELWSHDLNGAVIGAVPEAVVYGKKSFHEDPKIVYGSDYYYNMGVVLFDLEQWRACNIDNVVSEALISGQKYKIADQSIINKYIPDRLSRLPLRFNFYTFFHGQPSRRLLGRLLNRKVFDDIEIETASASPVIIHFVGNWFERPWYQRGKSIYKSIYSRYREKTAYGSKMMWPAQNNQRLFVLLLDEFIALMQSVLPLSFYLVLRYEYMQVLKKFLKVSR